MKFRNPDSIIIGKTYKVNWGYGDLYVKIERKKNRNSWDCQVVKHTNDYTGMIPIGGKETIYKNMIYKNDNTLYI